MTSFFSSTVKMAPAAGLILYYHPYSFYSQKVVMVMHEKKLHFEPVIINITKGEQYSPEFLKINPRGEVPVLQDSGKIIPDSARIIDYLEDNLSNGSPKMMPADSGLKVKVEQFRQMIDGLPAGVITMGSLFHPELCENPKMPFIKPVRELLKSAEKSSSSNLRMNAEMNPEAKDVLLKKAEFQDKKHEMITNKEEYIKILESVNNILNKIELQLSEMNKANKKWLCSDEFTLADVSLTILLVRLTSLGLEKYFWTDGKKPLVEEYYKRAQERESFKKSIPDLYFHLKILFNSQTPFGIGVGIIGTVGFIAGAAFIFKRLIL